MSCCGFLRLFDISVAGLLISASWLRLYQLSYHFPPDASLLGSAATLMRLKIAFEMILGLLIAGGECRKSVRLVVAFAFAIFASATIMKIRNGDLDCGCFGFVEIPPYLTLGIDVLVIGCLVVGTILERKNERSKSRSMIGKFMLSTVLAVGLVTVGSTIDPRTLRGDLDESRLSGGIFHLNPKSWPGKALPIILRTYPQVTLQQGKWFVLFVRSDCKACEVLLTSIVDRCDFAIREYKIVLVNVGAECDNIKLSPGIKCGALDRDHGWDIATPTLVCIESGTVVKVSNAREEIMSTLFNGHCVLVGNLAAVLHPRWNESGKYSLRYFYQCSFAKAYLNRA